MVKTIKTQIEDKKTRAYYCKQIAISEAVYNALKERGAKGETFDMIIRKLLESEKK